MDVNWFKTQQKRVGVTAEDIANRMGRSRTNVSHIYTGKQRMSLEWAQAFADVLQVPLDEVLRRAGALDEAPARQLAPGFAESDAVAFDRGGQSAHQAISFLNAVGAGRPGVDVWTVKGMAMALGGYLPGDHIIVDTHQSERCGAGDVVLAQVYDMQRGTAATMLRRYEPPALVAASANPDEQRIHVVDHNNVAIMGKVVGCWRGRLG